ncbi:hypothetical protein [Desertibacillus haloalkaliphilus]|uniref:hypothetical protein n=1 Tax=Desertibacillus haloalkaliphilus TaxID=1328930 RepID=UPI001C27816C|nr:hypothetical protein [Desertibacillus haloalkaliphilus]MBU8907437.1 hypothetical protein [Desertibacillus haloalkaliphilus]
MAFGITRQELNEWKQASREGQIAFLTHYWLHPKDPTIQTVTKVACADLDELVKWGSRYGLRKEWIHRRPSYSHFDLIGAKQIEVLHKEQLTDHIKRFNMTTD